MNRAETTRLLSAMLERHLNPHRDPRIYIAREVTFDYGTEHQIRVDYMRFKPVNNTVSGIEKGDVYCYEIKSSVEDFRSKHGHNFIGDYNYYVMPHEVYLAVMKEIPYYVGVYCPIEDTKFLTCMTPPRRRDRSRPVSEVLLMMFRSAARENLKGARKNGREKETD